MAGMNINVSSENVSYDTNIRDVEVPAHMRRRVPLGINYLDDLLGGAGLIPSMTVLFTGTPGAGKTTQLLQLADAITGKGNVALYISREEALTQVKMTTERLDLKNGFIVGDAELASEDDLDDNSARLWDKFWKKPGKRRTSIVGHAKHQIDKMLEMQGPNDPPRDIFLLLDSLQAFNDGKYGPGAINGQSPMRVIETLTSFCKQGYRGVHPIMFMIGQVTKGGEFSGKNGIKHAVDAHMHLYIDNDKKSELWGERLIEMQKNRFGCNDKKMVLGLEKSGLYKKGEFSWTE